MGKGDKLLYCVIGKYCNVNEGRDKTRVVEMFLGRCKNPRKIELSPPRSSRFFTIRNHYGPNWGLLDLVKC